MNLLKSLMYALVVLLPVFLLGCALTSVTILAPANCDRFEIGEQIDFTGSASDPMDGDLTGDSLVWASDRDGEIGAGTMVSTATLSAGAHEITLTATNSQGVQATATLFIIVGEASTVVDVSVENFRFDADANNSTLIDTVTINMGDTVRWVWVEGDHTVTSGEGSSSPDAGNLFDVPSNSSNRCFPFTYNETGTFPYFCRPHELLDMKGIITVQ